MSRETPYNADADFDRYLDGLMSDAERADFEARVEADAALRAQVEKQARIDAALKRAYAPPTGAKAILDRAIADAEPDAALSPKRGWRTEFAGLQGLAKAAVIVLAVVGLGWWFWWMAAEDTSLTGPEQITILAAYEQAADENFKPEWVCENDKEFASVFYQTYNQGMLMEPPPSGAKWTGIRYCNCLSDVTVCLLAKVDDKDVAVFVDRTPAKLDDRKLAAAGLHAFHRKIDNLYLTELSPLDHPTAISRFKAIDMPEDWKNYQIPYDRRQ